MTVDREEEEESAALEGEVASRFAERVGGVLDHRRHLTQVRSNVGSRAEQLRGEDIVEGAE